MVKSQAIDTNIIVHGIVNDAPEQRQKIHEFLAMPDTVHHVPDLAFYEAVYVLEKIYMKSREEIAELLLMFFTRFSDTLVYNRGLFGTAIQEWVAHPSLPFADCVMVMEVENSRSEPLYTLDKKLADQAGAVKLL